MAQYLLIRLYAPMAAWGDTAVGDFRPSAPQPSRTAVLGLLAAALGIRRDQERDLLALDRSTQVAVRLDLPGAVMRDFHTIQVPPESRKAIRATRADELHAEKLHTIVSRRDYRADSGASIALRRLDDDLTTLTRWRQALLKPAFPLYLGRKSCPPGLPLGPTIVEAENFRQALDGFPDCAKFLRDNGLEPRGRPDRYRFFWEGDDNSLEAEFSYPRHDRLRSRRRWQFDTRSEHSASHAVTDDPTRPQEH